ncbi:MAG: ABC transporter ATP-binding protein, partial [Mesorhizobium sp.]
MNAGAARNSAGATAPVTAEPVLTIANLSVSVRGEDGPREVVSSLSLTLKRGETLCIAGESGSG